MKLIKINKGNLKLSISEAKDVILNNGLVVYPTETVYGLGGNAESEKAVEKVFDVKGRDYNKSISIAVSSIEDVKKIVEWNENAEKLARKFLPGPLTLILKMKINLPEKLTGGENKIGIRIPDHPIALKLLREVKVPITATSANISGGKNPVSAEEAIKQIGKKVDLVLDVGECKYKKPSTVIDLIGNKILRIGVISEEEINETLRG